MKMTFTYIDYDGVERTEEHYFNVNKGKVNKMAHWIIDDHGFGGSYYKCSECGNGHWDILDDVSGEDFCPDCGAPIDWDANVYMRNGKVEK